ncbi:hypothetical protein A2V49_03975 [candidate division WWE3 bacterium RBG_19FT_COMBO_34_6]|uniref:DOT1 domain-containing protein n=1 Tax=candidate division WWE3 bacterium RBG_19FT_COMBO_34_6 TaxID=1802612 RepID=A0A1F4UM97_UNCKA|nr:MAG: hypothetical protein A2V49_03975 [candidate division WWE3 bacterium RBG_19FT_COMBO_34_6]
MRIIEKNTIRSSLVIAAVAGIVLGLFFSFFSTFYVFFVFIIFFVIGFSFVKFSDYIYKNIFFGGPPVHISKKYSQIILKELQKSKINEVIDLGSGNGHICFLLSDNDIKAYGIEYNLFFYLISKFKNIFKRKRVNFLYGNLWNIDFGKYSCLIIYPISYMMVGLEEKIKKEAKTGTIIVTYFLKFKNIKPYKKLDDVYFYKI